MLPRDPDVMAMLLELNEELARTLRWSRRILVVAAAILVVAVIVLVLRLAGAL